MSDMNKIADALIAAIDRTMPGRRIGSTPPKDWTAEATADLNMHYDLLARFTLGKFGLRFIRSYCEASGLPTEEAYLLAFRKAAIKRHMIEELRKEQS